MARLIADPNSRVRLEVLPLDGRRKVVRLGKCSQRSAERICRHIDVLESARISGEPLSKETATWLRSTDAALHERLARAGLVQSKRDGKAARLGAFIDSYIRGRVDAKPGVIISLKRVRNALIEQFGDDKLLASFSRGDADAFRLALLAKGLAENTVRRTCGRARQFFRAAIRNDLLPRNPFEGVKCSVTGNPERLYYVSREEAEKVLAACPDNEWRLIFALSRFAGLRCPSEHLTLRWSDVDWEHNRMTVHSPKTQQFQGKGSRLVPIFPELRPYLLTASEQASADSEYVIASGRDRNANLRTQMDRIVRRAGLTPWPKLFHNLRATRETELTETFPLHVVCAWIGNSQPIAAKHYLQVREEDFVRAAAVPVKRDPSARGTPRKAVRDPARKGRGGKARARGQAVVCR